MRLPLHGLAAAAALLLAGCAGYKLGPSTGFAAGARSVQVEIFDNDSRVPRAGESVSHAVRKQIQQDGAYALATRGGADVRLEGTLVRMDRTPLSYQPDDIVTPRDYFWQLTARVTATDSGGKTLWNREFTGRTTIRLSSDQTSAERQALPLVAEDLARKIVDSLVDGHW